MPILTAVALTTCKTQYAAINRLRIQPQSLCALLHLMLSFCRRGGLQLRAWPGRSDASLWYMLRNPPLSNSLHQQYPLSRIFIFTTCLANPCISLASNFLAPHPVVASIELILAKVLPTPSAFMPELFPIRHIIQVMTSSPNRISVLETVSKILCF